VVNFSNGVSTSVCSSVESIGNSLDGFNNIVNSSLVEEVFSGGNSLVETINISRANIGIWDLFNKSHGE
jgi:hypothetical protein